VYNRKVKIFRSVDNKLDIQVRNGDQKPINIVNKTLVFNLFSQDTNRLLLRKDLEVISNNGQAQVTLTEKDLNDLDEGFYNYSIVLEQRENNIVISSQPLYIDEQFESISVLEISGDIKGSIRPTDEIREFSYVNPRTQGEPESLYFISSIIDARPQATNPQTLHTFQIYFTDFDGKITIQGSMSKGGAPEKWVDLDDDSVLPGGNNFKTDGSPVVYKNVIGKWNWFRIKQTGHIGNDATFKIDQTDLGNYIVGIKDGGTNYSIGDVLIIEGRRLGGSIPDNNLVITVTGIDVNGRITTITHSGVSIPGFRTFVLEPIEEIKGTIDKILYR
jgi:hypothetical protein